MPNAQEITYCGNCADRAFKSWRGWPHQNAVPLLPIFNWKTGSCGTCQRKHWPLSNDRIGWLDYREADEYGLPDYWRLTVGDVAEPHWGRPYYAEGRCPRCEGHTIISEMKFPNGTHEFTHNCRVCGVVPLPADS